MPPVHLFLPFLSASRVSGHWLGAGHGSGPRGGTWAQEAGPGPMGTNVPLDPLKPGLLAARSTHLVNSWDAGEGFLFTNLGGDRGSALKRLPPTCEGGKLLSTFFLHLEVLFA